MSLMSAIGLNFQPLPLGLPCQIDGQELMAVMLGFDQRTLDRIYEMRVDRRRVLAEPRRAKRLHA